MLDRILESQIVPGSNLEEAAVAFADWRYLTSNPRPHSVLLLDRPEPHTAAFFGESGGRLSAIGGRHRVPAPFKAIPDPSQAQGLNLPLDDGSVDLVVAETAQAVRRLSSSTGLASEVARVLSPGGAVYLESHSRSRNSVNQAGRRLAAQGIEAAADYWLSPVRGPVATAAPWGDGKTNRWLFQSILFGRNRANQIMSQLAGRLSQSRWFGRLYPRQAWIFSRSPQTCPAYLRQAAARNDLDFSGLRLLMSARGRYRSNKIICFLIPRGESRPKWVVKLARDGEFNDRLEHEFRMLSHLRTHRIVDPTTIPRAFFLDEVEGLAAVCQQAEAAAQPFQRVSRGQPFCLWASRAVEWLSQLGFNSRSELEPGELDRALRELHRRFLEVYPLPSQQQRRLESMVERLAGAEARLFSVVQHGDPGVQNILVRPDKSLVFLDWESAELKSLPLWDLFYFLRTFVNWAERRRGRARALENFEAHFINRGRFTPLLQSAVDTYCRKLGLETDLVEPLFYTCWMHRCLKQAILLPPDAIWQGAYIQLLQSLLKTDIRLSFGGTEAGTHFVMTPAWGKASS